MILPLLSLLLLCSDVNGYIIENRDGKVSKKSAEASFHMRGSKPDNIEDVIVVALKPESMKIHDVIADVRSRHADPSDVEFVAPLRKEFLSLGIFTLDKPSAKVMKFLEAHEEVLSVTPSQLFHPTAVPDTTGYSWGTDRIDQRHLPLDDSYTVAAAGGAGTNIYVLDEGLDTLHVEFSNTHEREVENIFDAYSSTLEDNNDYGGHGTHCSGTAAGINVGVAPKANLFGLKVLGPWGGTSETIVGGMAKAFEHATAHENSFHVVSMSLGGYCGISSACASDPMNVAITRLAAEGILTVVAAGNSALDACMYAPSSAKHAITVGSTTKTDGFSYFSNTGACVNILAPGSDISSACSKNNDIADSIGASCPDHASYMTISGTSMACPHVTGFVSLFLAQLTAHFGNVYPGRMKKVLKYFSVKDLISSIPAGNTPNMLLHVPYSQQSIQAVFENLPAEMRKFAPEEEW